MTAEPLDDHRLDLLESRADYVIETENDGRVSVVSAYAVKELIEEVRRLRGKLEEQCDDP